MIIEQLLSDKLNITKRIVLTEIEHENYVSSAIYKYNYKFFIVKQDAHYWPEQLTQFNTMIGGIDSLCNYKYCPESHTRKLKMILSHIKKYIHSKKLYIVFISS